jgi:hypothetical protein
MKFRSIKVAVFLGALSSLAIAVPNAALPFPDRVVRLALQNRLVDITSQFGQALFVKNEWEIKIFKAGNRYIYSGKQRGKPGIRLTGGKLTRAGGKHLYTWNNAGTIYRVTWQPQDPGYARIQVFEPRDREIFNELMWTPVGN